MDFYLTALNGGESGHVCLSAIGAGGTDIFNLTRVTERTTQSGFLIHSAILINDTAHLTMS
jgi:hypothetical protein